MGMFDFVADVGHKLFSSEEEPAETIKKTIEADNPGIENLGVEFVNGFVTLSGKSSTAEAVEKAILLAGNIHGVGKVVSNIEVAGGAVEASTNQTEGGEAQTVGGSEFYTIKSGDTLSAIAKHFYGDASKYQKLFAENREVIKDPDKIFVGQKIRIPLAGN